MKSFFFLAAAAVIVAPSIAFAQPAPQLPPVVDIPTPLVAGLVQYLESRPYSESSALIAQINGCLQVQIPNAQGMITDQGQCQAVTDATGARQKVVNDLTKRLNDALAAAEKKTPANKKSKAASG